MQHVLPKALGAGSDCARQVLAAAHPVAATAAAAAPATVVASPSASTAATAAVVASAATTAASPTTALVPTAAAAAVVTSAAAAATVATGTGGLGPTPLAPTASLAGWHARNVLASAPASASPRHGSIGTCAALEGTQRPIHTQP